MNKFKLLYIHGFGSSFNPYGAKVLKLSEIFDVVGVTIDHTRAPDENINIIDSEVSKHGVDAIIGTSMGGYLATLYGVPRGMPVIAINPAYNPSQSLRRHIGVGVDYHGRQYELKEETVKHYVGVETIQGVKKALSFHGTADDVIDPVNGFECYARSGHEANYLDGADHRLEHIPDDVIEKIMKYVQVSCSQS